MLTDSPTLKDTNDKSLVDGKKITLSRSISYAYVRARSFFTDNSFIVKVYLLSRIFILLVAYVNTILQHSNLASELSNWDGVWYIRLASRGYLHHPVHFQTTLGFFPFYSMVMWALARVLAGNLLISGLTINFIGGFVSSVLLFKLMQNWTNDTAARRAVVIYNLFPGTVIFSMVYSEGITIPLVMGCILLVQKRRYIAAGILAFFATATAPDALALTPVLFVAFLYELKRYEKSLRKARQAFIGTLLSLGGIASFGIFLWIWTGTPLASYDAQRYGWKETTTPLALYYQGKILAHEVSFSHFRFSSINLNYVVALLGALYLVVFLYHIIRPKLYISTPALVWTLGISFFALTSAKTPPNPRLLLTAFPLLIVAAYKFSTRAYRIYLSVAVLLLVYMSSVTFVGIALRP